MKLSTLVIAGVLFGSAAQADCPKKSPSIEGRVSFQNGDKRVNAAWLNKTLVGKRVKFDDGTELYANDGSYSYKAGSQTWKAPSYKFYDNGLRCIDYPQPRFDMYVVNDGKLVLINANGNRFVGKVFK